jgi:hypothetical protein
MKPALLCTAGTLLLLLALWWCMANLHFRIGSRYLKILLFGFPIRRIALNDIAYVSKREPKGVAERWYSTFKSSHRLITIERKTGLRRYICITPQNRYVFLADLKSAIRRVDPTAEWAALRAFEDTTALYGSEERNSGEEASDPPESTPADQANAIRATISAEVPPSAGKALS